MNRREASKKQTRDLILKAAKELFLESGVEQTTMRAVARKAGVSPASVVVHFKSKNALLGAALFEDIEDALAAARKSLPSAEAGLLDLLLHIPKSMFAFYDQNRPLYRTLLSHTVFAPQAENPQLSIQLERYFAFVADLVDKSKQEGLVRPSVDSYAAAQVLASLYFGQLVMLFQNPDMRIQTACEMLCSKTDLFLTGILAKEDK